MSEMTSAEMATAQSLFSVDGLDLDPGSQTISVDCVDWVHRDLWLVDFVKLFRYLESINVEIEMTY
jgi:hypothetical protein